MIRFLFERIGCLSMAAGIVVLSIGFAAVQSEQPAMNYFFIGTAMVFFGFLLWNRLRKRPSRKARFSIFRKNKPNKASKRDYPWENDLYE